MPTYVYKFIDTGETIELQQAFTDDTLTEAVHPDTGKMMPVKKVFLPVGVTFKGDGFYKTDSRNAKSSSSKPSSSSGSSSTSDSSSSDTASSSSSSDSASKDTAAKSTGSDSSKASSSKPKAD